MTTTRTRGRPPLTWLTDEQLANVRPGAALCLELHGKHTARPMVRVITNTAGQLEVNTPDGERTIPHLRIKRARPIASLYEPGDGVRLRGIPASQWRGGVVRTSGTDVLVEQLGGTFAWHPEDALEPG